MLRLPGQVLRLGIAHDGVALLRTSRWFGRSRELIAEAPFEAGLSASEALAQALQRVLSAAPVRGWPLSVVFADEFARLWQVTPPPAARSLADLQAAAAMRYQALFGSAPQDWRIAADWQVDHAFLAAALPQALADVLTSAARAARCALVEVAPQLVAALNGWRTQRQQGAWFGVMHGEVLSLVVYEGARLVALRSLLVPAQADRHWLDQQLSREALRLGIAAPALLQVAGSAPQEWSEASGAYEVDYRAFGVAAPAMAAALQLASTRSGA